MAVASEVEWRDRFYELLGIEMFMARKLGDNLRHPGFANVSSGLMDGGVFMPFINDRRGSFYFRRYGRQILLDDDIAKIAHRMSELIPGLREQLLLFPDQLYCPPVHNPTFSFANICEKDPMHEMGLKRGTIYPFEILYYKFLQFFSEGRQTLLGGHHQPSQQDIERMEIKALKVSHLADVQEKFAEAQAGLARRFVDLAAKGGVFTSFEGDPREYLSLGQLGKKGAAVADLFQRLRLLPLSRLPFNLSDSLIEPFQIVIEAACRSNRLFWATYKPPALKVLKMICAALESYPSLSVFFLFDHALSVRNSGSTALHDFIEHISESVELSRRVEIAWGDEGVRTHPKIFGDGEQVAF